MFKLELPYPPKELNPNKKQHWAIKAKFIKSYKTTCFNLTKLSGAKVNDGVIKLSIEFVKPDAKKRDDDNIIAAFKAGRDGVAMALGVDDNRFEVSYKVCKIPAKGGAVNLTFES